MSIFFKKILFNWRIIALQNFVVFCNTSTRTSHRYTHVPSLPNLPPKLPSHLPPHPTLLGCHRAPVCVSWVTQQIPIGYLFYIWYCKFPCYSLHISHLLPPPLHSCLFLHCCPEYKFISAIFLDSIICVSIWYLNLFFWFTSLCIIGSRFIHLIRTDSNTFLFMVEYYSIVYMYHSFFIHSSVNGQLGCFHILDPE